MAKKTEPLSDDALVVRIARCKVPPKRAANVLARLVTCMDLASRDQKLTPKVRGAAQHWVDLILKMYRTEELR